MEGQALGLRNGEKGKEGLSPAFVRRILEELRKGQDQDTLELPKPRGSLGNAEESQLGFGQLKRACLWTQGTKIGMSHQLSMTQKKANDLRINT